MDAIFDFVMRNIGLSPAQQRIIVRAGWVTLVTSHILWACGWLAFLGIGPPFARAEDVKQTLETLKAERLERLDHDILNIRVSQCQAATPEAKRQYGERLQELITRYYQIGGRQPRVPGCDEV